MNVKPTFANVAAALALLIALSGSAYAIVVTGKDVKNGSLTGADVKDGSLRSQDLAPGVIPSAWHELQRDIVNLPDTPDELLTIATLSNLPRGSYLLNASTVASDFTDAGGYVRCYIYVGDQNMSGSLGSATKIGTAAGSTMVSQIVANATVSQSAPFDISLRCSQSLGAPGARVEESHLLATRIGRLVDSGDAQY